MIRFPTRHYGPLGVDLGTRSVKLIQFSADQTRLIDAVRWEIDLPPEATDDERDKLFAQALTHARQGRKFRGNDAVLCLGASQMFVENVRAAKGAPEEFDRVVQQEAAARIPFPFAETEIRYFPGVDVRQGEATKREIVLLACHRPVLERMLRIIQMGGLHPVAVDVEPAAVLRAHIKQVRREDDLAQRLMFVHIGAANTLVVVANGREVLFVKYVDTGGRQMDEAVVRHLNMTPADAVALRRHNGDRRAEQQDPEVARSLAESIRPVLDRLAAEISLCLRYQSVTFRGQPVSRVVLGGGEATPAIIEALATRLDLKCELSDPLRSYQATQVAGRRGQWDVAAGLALRDLN